MERRIILSEIFNVKILSAIAITIISLAVFFYGLSAAKGMGKGASGLGSGMSYGYSAGPYTFIDPIDMDPFDADKTGLFNWNNNDDIGSWGSFGGPFKGMGFSSGGSWEDNKGNNGNPVYPTKEISAAPEPASSALFLLGGLVSAFYVLRKKKNN